MHLLGKNNFVRYHNFFVSPSLTQRAAEVYLEQHNATHLLPPGTWEHDLVGTCRTHLHVKPKVTEGILFYSQVLFFFSCVYFDSIKLPCAVTNC